MPRKEFDSFQIRLLARRDTQYKSFDPMSEQKNAGYGSFFSVQGRKIPALWVFFQYHSVAILANS